MVTQQKTKIEKSGRNIKPHSFKTGDKVIVRRDTAKTYQPTVMEVTNVRGQTITAQDSEGKEVRRNSEWFKHYMTEKDHATDLPAEADLSPQQEKTAEAPAPTPRHTRSKGPVEEQPWVYSKERSKK